MDRYCKPHWARFFFTEEKRNCIACSQCGWVAVETSGRNDAKLLIPELKADGVKTITLSENGLTFKLSPTCPNCSAKMGIKSRTISY